MSESPLNEKPQPVISGTVGLECKNALSQAIDDLIWMSAASDFSPGGQAHEGWKKVRARIENYFAVLARAEQELS